MIKTGWKNDISGNLLKYRINESMKDREDGCINKWIYIYIYTKWRWGDLYCIVLFRQLDENIYTYTYIILDIKSWIYNTGYKILDIWYWIYNTRYVILDIYDTGYIIMDI